MADLLQQCREAFGEGRSLANGLMDEQFNWTPRLGVWSVGQCLMHLNVTNEDLLRKLAPPMQKARRRGWHAQTPFELSWIAKTLLAGIEPPVKMKLPAAKHLTPLPSVDRADCMRRWADTHDEFLRVMQMADGLDLRRIHVPSPVSRLIRYNLGTLFHVATAHDRRHLWQASRLLAHPQFPRTPIRAGE